MDCVEYLSYWLLADILVIDHLINILVIDYLLNISFSLFSLCSWALLSLMVWLRACSDNRSAYSLWENLSPCSTMEESISCWRKKSKSNKEIIYRFSSRSQLQNIPTQGRNFTFLQDRNAMFSQEGFSTVIADRFCQHSSNQQNQGNFPRKDTGLDTFARWQNDLKFKSKLKPGNYTVWYKLSLGVYL